MVASVVAVVVAHLVAGPLTTTTDDAHAGLAILLVADACVPRTSVVAGLATGGGDGIALAVIGLVPIGAGAFSVCLVAPLLHVPFSGRDAR